MAECKGTGTRCWHVNSNMEMDAGEHTALCGDPGLGGDDLLERETCLSLEAFRAAQVPAKCEFGVPEAAVGALGAKNPGKY